MFQKKDYIYSETMGVCLVSDVTGLAPKKGTAVPYYVLRSVYEKDKVAYIPVENHTVKLRELISPEDAKELAEEWQLPVADETADAAEEADALQIPEGMTEEEFVLRKGEVRFVIRREEMNISQKKHKKEDRP